MRKAAILLVAAVMAFAGAAAVVGTAKAETEKELKYVSFRTQTETDWTSFSWGDAGAACTVEKSLVDEHSKDEDKALKMTKTVTLAGNSFAAVYYQNLGAKAQALNVTEPYGIRLTVYSEKGRRRRTGL